MVVLLHYLRRKQSGMYIKIYAKKKMSKIYVIIENFPFLYRSQTFLSSRSALSLPTLRKLIYVAARSVLQRVASLTNLSSVLLSVCK